jgi:hypothetical protein
MSVSDLGTNVYYLTPPLAEVEPPAPPSRRRALRLRLLTFWWRLRLTVGELGAVLRRFGRPPATVDTAVLLQHAEMILASRRPSVGPAQVIDFATARQRLRA